MNIEILKINILYYMYRRPPSLSKLTPIISYMGLTHLGSDASILPYIYQKNTEILLELVY